MDSWEDHAAEGGSSAAAEPKKKKGGFDMAAALKASSWQPKEFVPKSFEPKAAGPSDTSGANGGAAGAAAEAAAATAAAAGDAAAENKAEAATATTTKGEEAEEEGAVAVSAEELKELKRMLSAGEITDEEYAEAIRGVDSTPSAEEAAAAQAAAEAKAKKIADKAAKATAANEAREAALARKEAEKVLVKDFHDDREHVNVVFIGHVDAGKSTISGQILYLTGQVDQRQIAKYEKEAKERQRDSWFLAYIMDTDEAERAKGKTVQVGMAHFETKERRFTLLDAPGHKAYVPNMIGGTQQADVAVLVISARKGEFEAGFMRGGQTREHAMLAFTLGIKKLVILINKMDDPSVKWNKKRFDEIKKTLAPFLRKEVGFKVKRDCYWIPASGLKGLNIIEPMPADVAPWHEDRRSLLQLLTDIPLGGERDSDASLVVPVMEKYSERGTWLMGKVQRGTIVAGKTYTMLPNRTKMRVEEIIVSDQSETSVAMARVGENVRARLKGAEESDCLSGFVLIEDAVDDVGVASTFEAQMIITELLEHRPLLTAGYNAIIHIHNEKKECQITKLLASWDFKTKEWIKAPRFLKNKNRCKVRIKVAESIALATFNDLQCIGRFTLRDEEKTIAIGMIEKLPNSCKMGASGKPLGKSSAAGKAAGSSK